MLVNCRMFSLSHFISFLFFVTPSMKCLLFCSQSIKNYWFKKKKKTIFNLKKKLSSNCSVVSSAHCLQVWNVSKCIQFIFVKPQLSSSRGQKCAIFSLSKVFQVAKHFSYEKSFCMCQGLSWIKNIARIANAVHCHS